MKTLYVKNADVVGQAVEAVRSGKMTLGEIEEMLRQLAVMSNERLNALRSMNRLDNDECSWAEVTDENGDVVMTNFVGRPQYRYTTPTGDVAMGFGGVEIIVPGTELDADAIMVEVRSELLDCDRVSLFDLCQE